MARLVHEQIDAESLARNVARAGAGAVLTFAGTVRNHARGSRVIGIEYHAYESMAVREMTKIETEIRTRWPGTEAEPSREVRSLRIASSMISASWTGVSGRT